MDSFFPVLLITMGCRLNQADTALISSALKESPYQIVDHTDFPAVIVINTCAVTAAATSKSRQMVRRQRKKYPNAIVVVTGCSVTLNPSSWIAPDLADFVLLPSERAHFVQLLTQWRNSQNHNVVDKKNLEMACSTNEQSDFIKKLRPLEKGAHKFFSEGVLAHYPFKSRAQLKIQEGCNNFCSYCIVPYARGAERSREIEEIRNEFKLLLEHGHREIVLSGVNTCTFKMRNGGGLSDLLQELLDFPGDFRIRLSSTEPHEQIPQLIALMKAYPEKLCRFLHLALQHATNPILQKMNRHYTIEEYKQWVHFARCEIPDIHIGTDFIIGFPGETDALFEEALIQMDELAFANVHLFNYSARVGTPAAQFPDQVSSVVAQQRHKQMRKVVDRSAFSFRQAQIKKPMCVCIEKIDENGCAEGWSDHYLWIKFKLNSPLFTRHSLVRVMPEDIIEDDFSHKKN